MIQKPKFVLDPTERDELDIDKPGISRNIYIDPITDKELRNEVNTRKDTERAFNVSRLLIEAWSIYKLVRRFHTQSKSVESVYNFTLDALESFISRKAK